MKAKPLILVVVLMVAAEHSLTAPPGELPVSVRTVDLQRLGCHSVTIDADGVRLKKGDSEWEVLRKELAEAVFATPRECDERPGVGLIETVWGDRLPAEQLSVSEGKLRFRGPLTGEAQIDLGRVTALYLPDEPLTAAQVRRRAKPILPEGTHSDLLVVVRGQDDWSVIDGVLQGIDDEELTFRFRDADRRVKRRNVAAVLLSATERSGRPAGRLVARDGSVLAFREISLDGERAELDTFGLGPLEISQKDIAVVRFESEDVVPLSGLEPEEVVRHGLFGDGFEPRLDVSAGGSPLRLDGRQYDSGLGLHSFCEVTYDLGGEYRLLAAVVGIDDAVRPLGDATLTILADGEALVDEMRIAGTDDSETLRLDVSGAKKLTIRVEFGDDSLDVSDHVNLAAARLIR